MISVLAPRRTAARRTLCWATAAVMAALVAVLALSAPAAEAKTVPFMKGFTVAEWGPTAYDPADMKRLLKRLKARGVDTVTIPVVWMQRNTRSSQVRPGSRTAKESRIVAAMKTARKLKMRVILRPYIDLDNNGWRGDLRPSSPSSWWRSYRTYILKYATLANKHRAVGFVIGSEMRSLSPQASRWRSLARDVRKRYKRGFITYQANHDETVRWWGSVDAISISAYHPIAVDANYTVDTLVAGWRNIVFLGKQHDWFAEIKALAAQYKRPLMFGEIGYRTVDTSPIRPWDINIEGKESPESQQMAYEAAFRVWYRDPDFRGFFWWYTNPTRSLLDGQPGADHRPATETWNTIGTWYRTQARRG